MKNFPTSTVMNNNPFYQYRFFFFCVCVCMCFLLSNVMNEKKKFLNDKRHKTRYKDKRRDAKRQTTTNKYFS